MSAKASPSFLARRELGRIQNYEPGKPIEELEREQGIAGAIKMASNENPFGPSPKALQAIRKGASSVNRYPDAHCHTIRRALARHVRLSADQLMVGNGSDEIISLAVRAFLSAGQEMITATPTFLIYRIQAQIQGGVVTEIPMKDFRYDLERMAQAVGEKTKLIFIANPDNPIGTYVTHKELESFVNRVPARCVIFIDEAYYEFAFQKRDFPRSIAFLDRPNIIISRTLSKAYGLSGVRVGYALSNPQIIRSLNKVREPFNVNSLAQAAGVAALKDLAFVRRVVKTTEKEKSAITRFLKRHQISYVESATNFILMRLGQKAGAVYQFLLKKGVIVRWMQAWGLQDYLRVTIGQPRENRIFMKTLELALKHTGGSH